MTPREELHHKRLAELAQNLRSRRQAGVALLACSITVVLSYFLNWNLLWLLLLWPCYWLLLQWIHYDREARMDWQFMHMTHPDIQGRYDSIFSIPVPWHFRPLPFPEGYWADEPAKKSRKRSKKTR